MRPLLHRKPTLVGLLIVGTLTGEAQWLSPQPGDTVLMGRPLFLHWQGGQFSSASVWYSTDTGKTWQPLFLDNPTDRFLWNVPAVDTVQLLLRLRLEYGATPVPIRERKKAHQAPIRCARFSPDGTYIVTTGEDGVVKLWNTATLEAADVLILGTRTTSLNSAAFVRDSSRLLITVDSLLLLYDRISGQRTIFGFGIHRSFIRDLAIHPSGRYAATAADDSLICLWDLESHQPLVCWGEPGVSSWYSVAFSPDGALIAYGGNDGIVYLRQWQQPGQPMHRLGQHGDSTGNRVIWSLSFGTEEQLLASGGVDRVVRLWDSRTGRERSQAIGHRFHVRSVRALPWGRRIVSGSLDSTVRQWTPSGTPLNPILWHGGQVLSVDYSLDGKLIVSVGRDSAIRLWASGIEQSREDTLAVVLKYPIRLRLPSLAGVAGKRDFLPVLHEDYDWIPLLQTDSFACRITLRIPAWLLEREGESVPRTWDTVHYETRLRATDTLFRLALRYLEGIPPGAPMEILSVDWHGTEAFRAELTPGFVSVQSHCPGTFSPITTGHPLRLQLRRDSPNQLTITLLADEDGGYQLRLYDSMGREVWHSTMHLQQGEHVFSPRLDIAPGVYWFSVHSPSRRFVQPFWHSP